MRSTPGPILTIPDHAIIGGREWSIRTSPKNGGGAFDAGKQKILIGMANGREAAFQTFLHEVIEAILAERMMRYRLPYQEQENGHLMFVFTHSQFEEAVKDIYAAIRGTLK